MWGRGALRSCEGVFGGARSPLSPSLSLSPPHSPHGSRAVFRGARGARRGRDVTAGAKWREKAAPAAMAPGGGSDSFKLCRWPERTRGTLGSGSISAASGSARCPFLPR